MIHQAERGTKRRCQSDACGLPFYDLKGPAISCPSCGASYAILPPRQPVATRERRSHRPYLAASRETETAAAEATAAAPTPTGASPSRAFDEPEGPMDEEAILEPDDGSGDDDTEIIADREAGDET